jgi:FMNH2-dependent dimethyl sulfone monooxygenase
MNDIKGISAPALDAWSTAAALAAVTSRLELMVAVRPNFHQPAAFAKMAAMDHIAGGRLAPNVVSSWWADEARRFGLLSDRHDDRYARTGEWLTVVKGCGARRRSTSVARSTRPSMPSAPRSSRGPPSSTPAVKARPPRRSSPSGDAYVMHGDAARGRGAEDRRHGSPPRATGKLRRCVMAWPPMRSCATVKPKRRELARTTAVSELPAGYATNDWLSGTQLEREMQIQEYAVSNRGLRPNLVGTPEQLRERIDAYEAAGLDLLLLQMSPQAEEMERFAAQVMRR